MKIPQTLRRHRKALDRARGGRSPAALLCVGLVLGAFAGCSADAKEQSAPKVDAQTQPRKIYGTLGVQDVRLSLPATDSPRGVAVFFHGQTGGVDNRMDEGWLQSLVQRGWIVASSDFHTASWGNADSTEDTRALVDWAEAKTGEPVRLFVSGSMGATVSLNAMTHGVPSPPCYYGVKPAVDLTKMSAVPGANRIIKDAYGDATVPFDRNPVNELNRLSTTTRYRLVSSLQDRWVLRSQNTDKLAAALKKDGAQVSVLTATGTHDDPSHFNTSDLDAFADSCAG